MTGPYSDGSPSAQRCWHPAFLITPPCCPQKASPRWFPGTDRPHPLAEGGVGGVLWITSLKVGDLEQVQGHYLQEG